MPTKIRKKQIIKVKNLDFYYGGEAVLKNLSFSVDEGEYLGIIGPNGGGKTTLIKILLGLLKPSAGTIEIFDKEITSFNDYYRVGYVPQRIAHMEVNFPVTVDEIITSGRTVNKGPFYRLNAEDKKALGRVMAVADVLSLRNKLIGNLSGGERQRVFIARALASEPDILILDEPTVGVDVSAQKQFYKFLKELNQQQRITILFVTHDLDMISNEATKVLCLNHGLVCYGLPSEAVDEKTMRDLYETDVKFIHNHSPHEHV